jgi:hypothetical protein
MFAYLTFLLLLIVLLLLWLFWKGRKPGGFGTRIVDPDFQPFPRPTDTFVEPPRQEVSIRVVRNAQGIPVDLNIGQRDLRLKSNGQLAWNGGANTANDGGRVDVRFSPNATPFGGSTFITARGGTALSGVAKRRRVVGRPLQYLILVRTPDGFLLDKTATVTLEGGVEQHEMQIRDASLELEEPPPEGGYGTRIVDPGFELLDRPEDDFDEGARKTVTIRVVRDATGVPMDVVAEPDNVTLGVGEQVAWTSSERGSADSVRIEILFAPIATPFAGDTFITARSGTALSGFPIVAAGEFEYRILATTPDGFFLKKEINAKVTV